MKKKTNLKRRNLILGSFGAGVVLPTLPTRWRRPLIDRVLTPAHAQTSPPPPTPPEDLCPMISVGNVVFGPVSGTNTPPVCTVTFDVLSSDASTSLEITDISNNSTADTTVTVTGLGVTTDVTGPRVVWTGPAADAPFCRTIEPSEDVTFTVTATCAAVTDGGTFTQDFTLSAIVA